METCILQLISALRASGVRISLAESAEAFSAIDLVGISNRYSFMLSLRSTLIKESKDLPVFDYLFPLFFGQGRPPLGMDDLRSNLSPDELQKLVEALKNISEKLRQNIERLLEGKPLRREELELLAKMIGLHNIDDLQFKNWMTTRMERALGLSELENAIRLLLELLEKSGFEREQMRNLSVQIDERLRGYQQQISQYTGERIAENLSHIASKPKADDLANRPFRSLTQQEKQLLQAEVKRIATALRTRIALRQRRSKAGQLDAKSTIRANLKHHMVPLELRFRNRIKKPKIVVLCDISTSMRFCSQLMLSFIYALQGHVRKTHAFTYIDHLEYISEEFSRNDGESAVASILHRMPSGSYNTDLGWALTNFLEEYLDTLNGHTTLIVVGDGRNNFNNPRLDIFKQMSQRASRTIWLNPESPEMWGTGDSDMNEYAELCDSVYKVSTLAELTTAVNNLMAS